MPIGIYEHKPHTQETKDKMSLAKFGEKNGMYGKKHTQEAKDKISKANMDRGHSQETKDKISEAMTGKNSGENNYKWRGNEYQGKRGRWIIWINRIKYLRARYIAEQCLGRKLIKEEIVHHINGNKSDDRSENLYLFTRAEHAKQHMLKNPPILISNLT